MCGPARPPPRLTGGAAHTAVELARGLTVRPERMRANLAATGGQLVSERLATALAPRLGRAAARQLLTDASLRAANTARPLADILAEDPDVQRLLTPRQLSRLLDPADYTGAAAALVDQALDRARPTGRRPKEIPVEPHSNIDPIILGISW